MLIINFQNIFLIAYYYDCLFKSKHGVQGLHYVSHL